MENNQGLTIRKVPLDSFIDLLMDLYNRGVDYVDLVGVQDKDNDRMAVTFKAEYMMKGAEEAFNEEPPLNMVSNTKLSDEDINDLI